MKHKHLSPDGTGGGLPPTGTPPIPPLVDPNPPTTPKPPVEDQPTKKKDED